jgi:hypothetical protein
MEPGDKGFANTWTYVEEADVNLVYGGATTTTRVGYNGANDIVFQDEGLTDGAGATQPLATALVFYMNDTIVEADLKINDAYAWDAGGSSTAAAYDLQSVVLREFGHLLGLGHDADAGAVMYDSIAGGTRKRALNSSDRRGVAAVYPCAEGSTCNPDMPADPPFAPEPQVTPPPADAPPAPGPTPLRPGPAAADPPVYLPLVQDGA